MPFTILYVLPALVSLYILQYWFSITSFVYSFSTNLILAFFGSLRVDVFTSSLPPAPAFGASFFAVVAAVVAEVSVAGAT